MTDGGASSESDRLRAGSEVSSLKGWPGSELLMHAGRAAGRRNGRRTLD